MQHDCSSPLRPRWEGSPLHIKASCKKKDDRTKPATMNPPSRLVLQAKPARSIKPIPSSPAFRPTKHNLSTATVTTNQTAKVEFSGKKAAPPNKINPTIQRAFQESLKYLRKDSEKLEAKLNTIKSSLKNDQSLSPHEGYKEIERLEILSQINDFQIRKNHHLGQQVDMVKPVYRFLEQQRWRKEGRLGRLMETVHRLRVFPDLCPSFHPQVDLKIKFPFDQEFPASDRFVNVGNFVPSSKSMNPPTIQVQVFHEEPRLYTIVMVDPDVPDPKNHTFTSFLHWLVPNVPISATDNAEIALKKEGEWNQQVEYIGPHPAEGSGHHRYTILIFEQANNSSININDELKSLERVGFSTRKLIDSYSLKPAGVLTWVSQWDPRDASSISAIYTDQLKIPEPRYGTEPKPYNPRVKLPPHTNLPLTHRHPPVIPWRERSALESLSS